MLFKRLSEDIDAFMARDPAARSRLEILLCYPGLHALLLWRVSSALWRRQLFLPARIISQLGRLLTAVEIHPGAVIGRRLVIDHGTGVVIGETAEIGDDVTLYQGVTLGGIAPSVDSHMQVNVKRHPTLRAGVIVGSGAQVLGPIVVGEGARIGANSVVTREVEPGITVVGIPAHAVAPRNGGASQGFSAYGTPAGGCPDPVLVTVEGLRSEVAALAARVQTLQADLQSVREATGQVDGETTAAADDMPGAAVPKAAAIVVDRPQH